MMLTGDSFYPGTVRSTRINLNIGTLAVLVWWCWWLVLCWCVDVMTVLTWRWCVVWCCSVSLFDALMLLSHQHSHQHINVNISASTHQHTNRVTHPQATSVICWCVDVLRCVDECFGVLTILLMCCWVDVMFWFSFPRSLREIRCFFRNWSVNQPG
jgi:hypothetical protein